MEKLSDKLDELTPQGEVLLSDLLKRSLEVIRQEYADEALRFLAISENMVGISLELAIDRPNRVKKFRRREPVLITINSADFPSRCPNAYSDRMDFPADETPHVNPVDEGLPYSLCLFRGDSDSWFAQHTLSDFIERLRGWLEDAACGNLNHPSDEFEFIRLDNPGGIILFPEADALSLIERHWTKQSGRGGIAYCTFSGSGAKVTDQLAKGVLPILWLIQSHDPAETPKSENTAIPVPKEAGIGGYLFFPNEDFINSRYVVNLPSDLGSLVRWAREQGIEVEGFIRDHGSSTLASNQFLPLIFAIRRPRKVLNHLSDIEFIAFLVEQESDIQENDSERGPLLKSVSLLQKNTPQLAKRLSARPLSGLGYDRVHLVGLGAIGSKLALHLAKAGTIPTSLIDNDLLFPHNNIRNGLIGVGSLKVSKVLEDISKIYAGNHSIIDSIDCHPFKLIDALNKKKDLFTERESLIIDSTASYAVEKLLNGKLTASNARYARVEIAHQGRLSFLRIEGKNRNPCMGDLMVEAYDQSLTDDLLSEWLRDNKGTREQFSVNDEIYLGLGCSSDTFEMADDKVSYHAAAASMGLRKILDESHEEGVLQINYLNENSEWFSKSAIKNISPVKVIKAENNPGWQFRFKHGLYERLMDELDICRPLETGGVFVGLIDQLNRIVYVTRIIAAPSDSRKFPSMFTRGTSGLTESIDEVRHKSGAMMDYVGEWHTHPAGGSRLSETDKSAIREIRDTLDPLKYPTIVTIVSKNKIAPYIFTKYLDR